MGRLVLLAVVLKVLSVAHASLEQSLEAAKAFSLGIAYMQLNNLPDAEAAYERALLADPSSEGVASRMKVLMYGETLLWQNKTHAARDVFQAAVKGGYLEDEIERPIFAFEHGDVSGRSSAFYDDERVGSNAACSSEAVSSGSKVLIPSLEAMARRDLGALRLLLERNADVIRSEFLLFRAAHTELRATHTDAIVTFPPEGWARIPYEDGCRGLCPALARLLQLIEEYYCFGEVCPRRAEFSILGKNAKLRPHSGPTNLSLTIHLGLVVPHQRPPLFCAGSECRAWQEGKAVIFNESFEHNATGGDSERVVLLFKVPHPKLTQGEYKEHYGYFLGNMSLLGELKQLGNSLLLEDLGSKAEL